MAINILYIEDNPDNMLLIKRVIEAQGYNFFHAPNGLEGIAIAEREVIDVILLDINLPDIDGYEVARRLRKSPIHRLAYVPIIAITLTPSRGTPKKRLKQAAMFTCPNRLTFVNYGRASRAL